MERSRNGAAATSWLFTSTILIRLVFSTTNKRDQVSNRRARKERLFQAACDARRRYGLYLALKSGGVKTVDQVSLVAAVISNDEIAIGHTNLTLRTRPSGNGLSVNERALHRRGGPTEHPTRFSRPQLPREFVKRPVRG